MDNNDMDSHFLSFFLSLGLTLVPTSLWTSLKDLLKRRACLLSPVLSLVACKSFLVILGGSAMS